MRGGGGGGEREKKRSKRVCHRARLWRETTGGNQTQEAETSLPPLSRKGQCAPCSHFSIFPSAREKKLKVQGCFTSQLQQTSLHHPFTGPTSPYPLRHQSPLRPAACSHSTSFQRSASLSTAALCWNWSTSNSTFQKDSVLCPFPKLWLPLKKILTHGSQHQHAKCPSWLVSGDLFIPLRLE